MENEKRSSFSGRLGFVLSAAGASVGLGNIWRFPYLAAKYGGGIFLLIYIVLALTFGYTMIMAETALGRMTGKSPVGAYASFAKPGKRGGFLRLRRLDQRHHPGADRTVLLGHRRLGHPVSGGVSRRPKPGAGGGRLLLGFHFQRCCNRDLLPGLCGCSRWASSLRVCATASSVSPK